MSTIVLTAAALALVTATLVDSEFESTWVMAQEAGSKRRSSRRRRRRRRQMAV